MLKINGITAINEILTKPTTIAFSTGIYTALPAPLTNSTVSASCAYADAATSALTSASNAWTGTNSFSSITTTPNTFSTNTCTVAPISGQLGYYPATTGFSTYVICGKGTNTIRALPNTGILANTAAATGTIPAGTYIFLYRQQFQNLYTLSYAPDTTFSFNIGIGLTKGASECFSGTYIFQGTDTTVCVNALGFYQSTTPFQMFIWVNHSHDTPIYALKVNFYASYMRIA